MCAPSRCRGLTRDRMRCCGLTKQTKTLTPALCLLLQPRLNCRFHSTVWTFAYTSLHPLPSTTLCFETRPGPISITRSSACSGRSQRPAPALVQRSCIWSGVASGQPVSRTTYHLPHHTPNRARAMEKTDTAPRQALSNSSSVTQKSFQRSPSACGNPCGSGRSTASGGRSAT